MISAQPISKMITESLSGSEILIQLKEDELEELRELYKLKYGSESFQYLLIYTQCNWNKYLKENHIGDNDKHWTSFRKVFYSHKCGDFRRYGTYVCLHQDIVQSVSFHSWEPNFNELLECLTKTELIQWQNGPLLVNVAADYSEEVKKIAADKGATIQRSRFCQGLVLTHADALKLSIIKLPSGYKLEQLHANHAELIHSLWANNKEGSSEYIKGLLKINKSIGIFEEASKMLVGWIFQNEFSGLGILQILPSVQRKGFGTILAATLSKLIARSESVNLSAWFVVGNVKSETLLEKIGYKKTVVNEWVQFNKTAQY